MSEQHEQMKESRILGLQLLEQDRAEAAKAAQFWVKTELIAYMEPSGQLSESVGEEAFKDGAEWQRQHVMKGFWRISQTIKAIRDFVHKGYIVDAHDQLTLLIATIESYAFNGDDKLQEAISVIENLLNVLPPQANGFDEAKAFLERCRPQ